MDKTSILQRLQNVNLSPEEAILYVELLKLNETSIVELAKNTSLKRSSVYNYVEQLVDIGLASWIMVQGKRRVRVENPQNLVKQTHLLQNQLIVMQNTLDNLIPELNLIKKQHDFSTEVKYYKGQNGIREMITNTLSAHKNVYGYSAYGRNKIAGIEFMKDFRKKWIEKKLMDYVIINDQNIPRIIPKEVAVDEYLKYQEVRYLPKQDLYITSDIMIYNNVYAVASLDPKNPMGIEIHNEEIVKTQMSIFNIIWKSAKEMSWQK